MNLDLNRNLIESLECAYLLFVDKFDSSLTALELSTDNVASIADLDLQLSIITSCLKDGLIFHQIPVILVWIVCTTVLFQETWVKLESADFIKHWAYILVDKFVDVELVIEVAVPKH